MRHPGYVRNFESALAELARRGHEVHVAFDSLNTKWMAGADPLGSLSGNERITFDRSPRVRTGWQQFATVVRSCDDFLRYQRPEYANAPKLRKRAAERLPPSLQRVMQAVGHHSTAQAVLRVLDGSMRIDPRIVSYIREQAPDIVLVTPLVGLGSTQADYLKAAHMRGVPAGLCVASWDNLTNKGLIREKPDLVAVWNDGQRSEASSCRRTAPERSPSRARTATTTGSRGSRSSDARELLRARRPRPRAPVHPLPRLVAVHRARGAPARHGVAARRCGASRAELQRGRGARSDRIPKTASNGRRGSIGHRAT